MSLNLVRYASADGAQWGAVREGTVLPLPGEYASTAEVLGEGAKLARSLVDDADAAGVPLQGLRLLHPVPDARIACQGANYRSYMAEASLDPDVAVNVLFTRSTASLTGPDDPIVRPLHVRLLDYGVELGIVLGRAITGPVRVTDDRLADYVGGFVLADDVSARDVQLRPGQWWQGKSYRSFCPVGPYLCIPEPHEVARWRELRLTLSVNGTPRQDALAGDMVVGPAATLTQLSRLERLDVGDLLLTGTPGGVALQPSPPLLQRLALVLPEAKRWELFVDGQARGGLYLRPGDRVAASIRTADGAVDLGIQHNTVK